MTQLRQHVIRKSSFLALDLRFCRLFISPHGLEAVAHPVFHVNGGNNTIMGGKKIYGCVGSVAKWPCFSKKMHTRAKFYFSISLRRMTVRRDLNASCTYFCEMALSYLAFV